MLPEGMKSDSEEAKQLYEQRAFLANVAKPCFRQAADARRKYDQQWLARTLFWRGYQFSRYLPESQTVVLSSRQTSRVPVNYMASTMRAIRNQVTSFRPKFEVMPSSPTLERSKVQARYSQRLLDYYFGKLKLKKKIKDTITQALLYSVGGPWQVVYDEIKKEIHVWLVDPFDFYVDPLSEEYDDAEYMIKAVRSPMSAVTHNPDFNPWARQEITAGDATIAASEYKQFMIQAIKVVSPRIAENNPMVILYEGYFKRRRENGEVYLVKVIWTNSNFTPLVYEEIDEDEFDFVVYRGDVLPKDIYGEGWAKHVMPLNRALNSLETSAFEYNYRVAKGRLLVDRDSGVRAINNVHGEIVSANRGSRVMSLDMAPLPVAVPQQIERMWRYLEDISGVHEACVSMDTEILTLGGWKNQSEIKLGEKVLTYNLKKDLLEPDKIKNVHIYEPNEIKAGNLVSIKNKNIDALITENHRWPVFSDSSNGKLSKRQFKLTKDLKTSDHLVLSANSKFPDKAFFRDDIVELIGWYITEGSDHVSGLRITQSRKNGLECERIESCLRRLGYYRAPYQAKDGMYQYYVAKEFAGPIKEIVPQKELTFDFINKLTEQQANILYRTLLLGDGTEISTKTLFWSTNKNNVDGFQYLCTRLGFNTVSRIFKRSLSGKIYDIIRGGGARKPLFVVSVKDQTRFTGFSSLLRKDKFVKEVDIGDRVWCPETDNGTFVARRNGYVFITGNSLGRIPTGVKSGIGVAELKQADATSQDDLVDNLEDFLSEVAFKILRKIAKNYDSYKIIKDLGIREGDQAYFAVIGKEFQKKKKGAAGSERPAGKENQVKIGADWFDVAEIGEDNTIRVSVGSWLGYTKEALQQKVQSYYQLQLIDQSTALRLLEFGDIEDIVRQTRLESILKRPPQPGPDGQPQPDQMSLAMTENDMLLEGKEMPVSEMDDHYVHIAVHQDALGRGADEVVGIHIEKHQILSQSVGAPIPGSTGLDVRDQGAIAPPDMGAMMGGTPASAGVSPTNLPQQNIPAALQATDALAGKLLARGA